MAQPAKSGARKKPAPTPGNQRLLVILMLVSTAVSAGAIVWFTERDSGPKHGRPVDPDQLTPDQQDMADAAESFVLFWSTFHYAEATHVSTGDSLDRVKLAMEKERGLSAAEKQLAQELRKSVEGLSVKLEPTEIVDEEMDLKILRATATVKASDRTVRRSQEFTMVRRGNKWLVSSWDPGEPEGAPDDAAEPGLQLLPDADAGGP
jgi:hypothetical protein